MKENSSLEVNRRFVGQECLRLLWNVKVHYRFHKSLLLPDSCPEPRSRQQMRNSVNAAEMKIS
jgi:hypothetical protein